MKFSAVATLAFLATSVHGFSSYLDNLGKSGGGLSSFAPSSGSSYSYAPAPAAPASSGYSYGYSSAPAPAPYKSSFADMPANSSTNYMGALAGGNKMKSGKNFSGVRSTFRQTSAGQSSYLDGIKGKTMQTSSYTSSYGSNNGYSYGQSSTPAPAPAAYTSSFAPAPAAPNSGSYLENLNRGAGAAVSFSYSSMQNSFAAASGSAAAQPPKKAATTSAGYLASL